MTVWFTSDTHLHHANIIRYSGRPFLNQDGSPATWWMNRTIIDRWNETVQPNDTIYHLGDFAMGSQQSVANLVKKLSGYKILIRGNHDRGLESMVKAGFNEAHNNLTIELQGIKIYLSHIPVGTDIHRERKYQEQLTQPPPEHDVFLCGHVHEHWKRCGKMINVGVDQWDFRPVQLATLLEAVE